jgi:hypothetical protein
MSHFLRDEHEEALWVLSQIIGSLPKNRDWLDPAIELHARALLTNLTKEPVEPNSLWDLEAARAGICGSEYVGDPKRVFARVRQEREMAHERWLRAVQRISELEAGKAALENAKS